MADDGLKVFIEGKEYDLEDFELGELEWLEEELGDLNEVENTSSIKAALRFVYVIKHREDESFTLDDARKMKLTVFDAPSEEPNSNGAGKRPTKAAKGSRGKSGGTS